MIRPAALCAALALLFAACGEQPSPATRTSDPSNPALTPSPGIGRPTAVPAADGAVRGQGTVLEAGQGPHLCLGAVAESLPPQCSGPLVTNWSWAAVTGMFEHTSGVRWGTFVVTGTFDGARLTMTDDPIPLALYDAVAEPRGSDPFATRCPEPDGGWSVLDQSVNPDYADPLPPGAEGRMNDPAKSVVNVLVAGDPAQAEAQLREVWGGSLCVSRSAHTETELRAIQRALTELPGLLTTGVRLDVVTAEVRYDDGSLQAWADSTYGAGLVEITSALRPASP
jgi:hypothetical protein